MSIFRHLPLKVHCWGGLGSQLLALNYYLKIIDKFPKRKIYLVLHNGGITARDSEIDFLRSTVRILKVEDFTLNHSFFTKSTDHVNKRRLKDFFKWFAKFTLNFLNIVISDDKKIFNIKSWTVAVRCTYNLNTLPKQDIINLSRILGISSPQLKHNSIGVHYRLGDLTTFKHESLISPRSLSLVINNLCEVYEGISSVSIYSDTKSNENLFEITNLIQSNWLSIETLQTIKDLIQFKYFIGTNSKVSLWVAVFRWGLEIPGEVFLPKEMLNHFKYLTEFKGGEVMEFTIKAY